jgi:hypothetical protein
MDTVFEARERPLYPSAEDWIFQNMTSLGDFKPGQGKLRTVGLTLWVTMEPIPLTGTSSVQPILMGALLDTGSEVCGINPEAAAQLVDAARINRKIMTPSHGIHTEPALRCRITFVDGVSRELDFSIIKDLEPYKVLIGRDVMSEMKL